MTAYKMALAGIGKIACAQHIPSIAENDDFTLVATVSGSGGVDGIENFASLDELLERRPDITAIALTMPPVPRFEAARKAIAAGRHVMLEKPPGATLSEIRELKALAKEAGVTLFGSWHSRHSEAVEPAGRWLADRKILSGHVTWKENVREWHPGQEWIWEPGGLGVFDTGINALSILTRILPVPLHLTESTLSFPSNRHAPIAANLRFVGTDELTITADFDWRFEATSHWTMRIVTDGGTLELGAGGGTLLIDGEPQQVDGPGEYPGVYRRFAELLGSGESDLDDTPFVHVADAFLIGRREIVEPFET